MEAWHPAAQQKNRTSLLALGIGISLLLHLLISAFVVGSPRKAPTAPPVSFIDLKDVQFPSEAAAPAPAPPVVPIEEKVATPLPAQETPPVPEPVQQAAPPAAQQKEAAPAQPTQQDDTAGTSLGMGMTKGYFSSIGNGETLRDSVRGYYLEMLEKVNERWWVTQGVEKKQVRALVVNLLVARSGEVVQTVLVQSSGNPRYDKAVLAALSAAGPFPPLPAGYRENYFLAPVRLVPPLDLMAW